MIHSKRAVEVEWAETPGADITDDDVAGQLRHALKSEYGDVITNLGVDVRPVATSDNCPTSSRQKTDKVGWSGAPGRRPLETTLRFPVVMEQAEAEDLADALHRLADELAERKPRTAALYVDRDADGNLVRWAAEVLWVSDHEV